MKYFLLFALTFLVCLAGCKKENGTGCVFVPDTKVISVNINWEALEDSLPAVKTKKQLVGFLTRHPFFRDQFLGRPNYPNDSAFINDLFRRFTHPAIDTLLSETHRIFGDNSKLKQEFTQAFTNVKYYYPDFRVPKIQTAMTGLLDGADLLVSDSLIIIGLDFYLGKSAKYRPNVYEYMLRRYQPNFIVSSVMLLYGIDPAYNKTNIGDKTVLADMLTYGKAYYFAKHMQPCLADSILIGYSSEEIAGSIENENLIYARLIQNEVLYSTSHQIKQKYIEERPKTLEVGEKCPGRIATWIGWQIVNAYMKHEDETTLPELMNLTSPEKLFKDSKYRPEAK